jgi:NADP-dependent 3-hydroxy acid dehydrogenase YdfG
MCELKGKVVAITGAKQRNRGGDRAPSRRAGAKVVLGARRDDKLKALAAELGKSGGEAEPLQLDVTKRLDVAAFVKRAQDRFGRLDVLVSNAGLMPLSLLDELKVEEWDRMIDVNIRGVLHGIAAALPVFRAAGAGHFINVSSISGFQVGPTTAVYSGTKFAVRAISEGLRQEAGSKIRVTTISPGAVQTDLTETISNPALKKRVTDFQAVAIPPAAIARAIAYAIEQPADVDVNEIVVRPTAQAA